MLEFFVTITPRYTAIRNKTLHVDPILRLIQ